MFPKPLVKGSLAGEKLPEAAPRRDLGEGVGADPDIVVDNAPQDAQMGKDRQLETALATALEIASSAPAKPVFGPRPNLRPKPLPPRR